jgi:hypothetical protein
MGHFFGPVFQHLRDLPTYVRCLVPKLINIMMWVASNYSATRADHPDESHATRITVNVVRTGLRVKQINKFKGGA